MMANSTEISAHSPTLCPVNPTNEESSDSSIEEFPLEIENMSVLNPNYTSYTIEDHLSTLQSLRNHGFSKDAAIKALPRRRNKSQRPLAMQLAQTLYPELSEVAAIIRYDDLISPAKTIVRHRERELILAQQQPTNNAGGKLLHIQGPWAGQELDPVDLKGPVAIPMPVTIGTTEDFEPIFEFLAENKSITEAGNGQGIHGLELTWKNPILEFNRGIVYQDGRLDLCKKVIGPTHIGKLMESLESNYHIRHFLLGNNAISTTGAKRIAEFVHKYPNRIETWYLAGCHITRYGLSLLVPEMISSSSITNLWFKRNPFGPGSASILTELVLRTPHLRTLDLETTELGDEGIRHFIDTITGKPFSLRNLYLNANGIGQNACSSLAKYLADPHCALESLFLSTNPLGDAGMLQLAPGLAKCKTLKRLTLASTGLTSKGVSSLAYAVAQGNIPLQTLDIGASPTTTAHGQKFNYLDDNCIEALKALIMLPSLRWLNLGRSVFSTKAIQEIRSTAARSELVFLDVNHVQITNVKLSSHGNTEVHEGAAVPKSCSLEVRNHLTSNLAKYYPQIKDYDEFLNSEEFRFLRNTSDIRKIDSMYRTRDKRLGLAMDQVWEEDDLTWKLIVEDAKMAENV